MLGSLLTKWTIRLALACLAAYFAGRLLGWGAEPMSADARRFRLLRWIWTVGCVLFIAHVACAFQFTHHWSHSHAWQHTADETERMMGFSFGDGIYFSYLFLVLWVADVACLWFTVSRPWWIAAPLYLFVFFIAFNGAIVFEAGPTRPVGILVALALLPLAVLYIARNVSGVWRQKQLVAASQTVEAKA